MDTDRAYIFGLVTGGGIFDNIEKKFRIRLPYRQWGSYIANPSRSAQINRDIINVVCPIFRNIYNIQAYFEPTNSGQWNILLAGDLTELIAELESYGISCNGDLRTHATIKSLVKSLVDDNLKRRFIAGLADTIGSTNPNHRRFSDEVQIISFEIKGFNYSLVCDICKLLYSVNCFPDQILWNHPNFHCANDPYYKQWNKGFKIRVQIDQYEKFGAFAFGSKAKSLQENKKKESKNHEAIPCQEKELRATLSCVHPAEKDERLPEIIRGGHYLHNRHVCAVLGCEHAPYDAVKNLFSRVGDLVMPFPILCKDNYTNIENIISESELLSKRKYEIIRYKVLSLYNKFISLPNALLWGDHIKTGYPISEIMKGIAYIIAEDNELNGKRPKGSYKEIIEKHLLINNEISVEVRIPDLLTPLVVVGNDRGILVGAKNPDVYRRITSFDLKNAYKLIVKSINEKDLER